MFDEPTVHPLMGEKRHLKRSEVWLIMVLRHWACINSWHTGQNLLWILGIVLWSKDRGPLSIIVIACLLKLIMLLAEGELIVVHALRVWGEEIRLDIGWLLVFAIETLLVLTSRLLSTADIAVFLFLDALNLVVGIWYICVVLDLLVCQLILSQGIWLILLLLLRQLLIRSLLLINEILWFLDQSLMSLLLATDFV